MLKTLISDRIQLRLEEPNRIVYNFLVIFLSHDNCIGANKFSLYGERVLSSIILTILVILIISKIIILHEATICVN